MRNPRNWIIVALLAALPLAVLGGALAQQQRSTTVDVRVWQSVASPELFFLSIRSGGGSWAEAGTIPLTLGSLSESGDHRYGDLSVTLSTPAPAPTATPVPTATPTKTATPDSGEGEGEVKATPTKTSPTRTAGVNPTAEPTATPDGEAPGGGPGDGGTPGDGRTPGGDETSPTRMIAIEATATATPTATPSPTAEPTATPSATPEPSATPTPEPTATAEPSATAEAPRDAATLAALRYDVRLAESAVARAQAIYDAADTAYNEAHARYNGEWVVPMRNAQAAWMAAREALETARANLRHAQAALQTFLGE